MHDAFRQPQAGASDRLHTLLQLRFARQPALVPALLEAVCGSTVLAAVTSQQARRLQALLSSRSDAELECMARRGATGRTSLQVQLEVLLDGEATAAERQALQRNLVTLLQTADWPEATLTVRAVLLESPEGFAGPG